LTRYSPKVTSVASSCCDGGCECAWLRGWRVRGERVGCARRGRVRAACGDLVRLRTVGNRVRRSSHADRPRRDQPTRRPSPPRAQVERARAREPVLLPSPGARPLRRRRPVPQDGCRARAEVPAGRVGAADGRALPFLRHRGGEGHHARERDGSLAPVLWPLEPGRRVPGRLHPAGRKPASAWLSRYAGAVHARRRRFGVVQSPRRIAGASGARTAGHGRSRDGRPVASVACAFAPRTSCGQTARRGPRAREHDRLPTPPRQARRRPRRPLALPPGRVRGDHPRARARPHPRALREATRARGEAAEADAGARSPGRRVASAHEAEPPRSRRGLACDLEARRGVLRVEARRWRRLRLDAPARARSRPRLRARRGDDRRRVPAAMPRAPGSRGSAALRGRPHGSLHVPGGRTLLRAGRGARGGRASPAASPSG
jgi:hypothetical protein